MPKVTQRDIVDSVVGLRDVSATLRALLANGERDRSGNITITVRSDALSRQADYLDQVAEELTYLVPDKPVKVPVD